MNIQRIEAQMKSLCLTQAAVDRTTTFKEAELLDELSTLEEYETFDKDAHDAFAMFATPIKILIFHCPMCDSPEVFPLGIDSDEEEWECDICHATFAYTDCRTEIQDADWS